MNVTASNPEMNLPGFNLQVAKDCALFSQMAYDEPPTIQDAATDTQVLIHDAGTHIVVAFRGTKGAKDFITDARFGMIWIMADVAVHAGFWRAWKSVSYKIVEHIVSLKRKPIIFTGHSLGGALAQLAASQMAIVPELAELIEAVYTFGGPRIGNRAFAKLYDETGCSTPVPLVDSGYSDEESARPTLRERTFRFVNAEDIVPRVPPWFLGYRHSGKSLFFSTFYRLELSPTFWLLVLSDLLGLFDAWMLDQKVSLTADHSISDYIDKLQTIT